MERFTNSTKGVDGATPDTYGKNRRFQSPDGSLRVKDIDGASPTPPKYINKVSYGLLTRDATGELDKKRIRKHHNPLDPRYIHHSQSGRA